GNVYQAGTLSGNPVAVAAGLVTLKLLSEPGFYERLSEQSRKLAEGLEERAKAAGISLRTDYVGGMFGIYFGDTIPTTFAEVSQTNVERFKKFFHAMLLKGVYFAPSAFEAGFVSAAHDDAIIQTTLDVAEEVFAKKV